MTGENLTQTIHASCVSLNGRAVLIRGASGSGKSGLALQLMALGAELVSDDRTIVFAEGGHLFAQAPDQIKGLIEARGVGILTARVVSKAFVVAVVDMDQQETQRLPDAHRTDICGLRLQCFHNCEGVHFPAAILQYLKTGLQEQS